MSAPVEIRILHPADRESLERFLEGHPHTTQLLRGNLRQAGLVDRGERYQGTYAAAFEAGRVVGAAAHYWNGNLIVEAPRALGSIASCAVAASGRRVAGLVGAWHQVVAARHHLGLDGAAAHLASREVLYALELGRLQVPPALVEGSVRCRTPRDDELDLLAGWAAAYEVETLNVAAGPELEASSRERIGHAQAEGRHWLLEAGTRPVAYTAFNSVLPDCVQVGGVFTPPAERSRGYARCAVAGSLLAAREAGAQRSVLFTQEENRSARSAYEALGYRPVGDYGLVLFS